MPLDHYKTQVLLLHSEQSTLETLSSGFSDRYTVHCATSGTEALNTLGETPINVIISAQELPGMSGLEALREARKRSPETVGILLAGNADKGLEALVGDEEVFQVVRGNVTGDGLLKLVENATRQARLMALAESANDTAAHPDEPMAEHIVMETSENGSTIISDGTGRRPALNPEKVSAAAAVGARSVDVLVLTKDEDFLATVKESARGMHNVHYANTLAIADDTIRKHKVGVAVVDAAMVGAKVEQLTLHLRKGSPRLVSIVAGRRDDGEMLMDLINRGKVYRFLLKPVSPGRARLAVEASIKHHLEAPDSAFKGADGEATAKTPARVQPKPQPRPPAAPQARAKPAQKQQKVPQSASRGDTVSPVERGLDGAFDSPDSGLAATVSGLAGAVGDKLVRDAADNTAKSGGEGGSPLRNPKFIAIGAAALVGVIAIGAWLMSGDADTVETPQVQAASQAESQPPTQAGSPTVTEADVNFSAPAAATTQDDTSAEELANTIAQALGMAETALLDGRIDDADAALQRVAAVDPQNARLPFLTAQVTQVKLRNELATARAAIRDTRFEDAGNALAAARALGVADGGEIAIIADELRAARSEQQLDEVLALANARLQESMLLQPANDNARYYYELVLENEPGNTAARQGLDVVASKLVLQARSEIDNGNLDAAESLLAEAGELNPASDGLAATATALLNSREAIAAEERRVEAERAEQERLAREAEERAEQERLAREAEELAAQERTAAEAAAAPAESTTMAAAEQPPASIRTLTRTRYVAPKYPRAAERRNLSGWVDVVFTVTVDGTVKDIDVSGSEPGQMFVNASVRAVEKWEFEPVIENGAAIEKRVGVRMMFALD